MNHAPTGAHCFDASALLKVFTNETGSDVVRNYFNNHSPTKYTTPFCFYEVLTVLKVKCLYRREITRDEYANAAFRLVAWFEASSRQVKDIDLKDPSVFIRVRDLAGRHSLDLSDAFQILSVKEGYFSGLINDSRTILVTADEDLAKASRAEGVRCWNCLTQPAP
jgi:predicted nucleic acid-binding protein